MGQLTAYSYHHGGTQQQTGKHSVGGAEILHLDMQETASGPSH